MYVLGTAAKMQSSPEDTLESLPYWHLPLLLKHKTGFWREGRHHLLSLFSSTELQIAQKQKQGKEYQFVHLFPY